MTSLLDRQHQLQGQAKCQVKVMRLSLTKFSSDSISSCSRTSLLQLPKVFEAIHAGQAIKCLARLSFAPPHSKAVARMHPPADSKAPAFELGTAVNSSTTLPFDLVLSGRLGHSGVHELVLSCHAKDQGEVLRKVFRIEVQPSLAYSSPPQVSFLPLDELLVRFQLENRSKSLVLCLTGAEFAKESQVMVVQEYLDLTTKAVYVSPGDAVAIMFRVKLLSSNKTSSRALGRLFVSFTCGLGEDCELFFPMLSRPASPNLTTTGDTQFGVVGQPLPGGELEPGFLLHGT
ncbi:hypothetical protein BASA81_009793 [Batrachochytrium salamandrivorans]|nr:hypothetical protein BASA81_009793 [Batrachochytrium salamandrivorans]